MMQEHAGQIEEQPSQSWQSPVTWTGLILVGWLLYELTAQPALGVVGVCLKFGWEDFRTAWWLRRRDPERHRGQACFWLYVANGLWKAAVVAFVMGFAMGMVADQIPGPRRARALAEVVGAIVVTTVFGFALSGLAALRAIWLARRWGLRLWLHSAVHRACWRDAWPPGRIQAGQSNRLGCLLFTGVLLALILLIVAVFVPRLGGRTELLFGVACGLLGTSSLVLFFRACSLSGPWAESAADCWGEAPAEPALTDPSPYR
jgi:hypothetical protein